MWTMENTAVTYDDWMLLPWGQLRILNEDKDTDWLNLREINFKKALQINKDKIMVFNHLK